MLRKFSILSLFLTCFFMQAFSQTTLIGKWRRINANSIYHDTTHKQLKWGDIEIRSDSTFHMEGDSSTQNSSISGWHVGDEYNGTWELQNKKLTLWLEPKENKMFLWFIVVKLAENKLVLRSGFNINDKRHDITYVRL